MAIQFPNSPSNGQTFTASNNIIYRWDGEKWTTIGSANANTDNNATFVEVAGDTMTGALNVPAGLTVAELKELFGLT